METSLRYSRDRNLCIHAKERFPIASNLHFQVHGELDTVIGAPNYFAMIIRNYYPELSGGIGLGLKHSAQEGISYTIHGKKAFPISSNALFSLRVKGRYNVDKNFAESERKGAAELLWGIPNLRMDQDVTVKAGYEFFEKGLNSQPVVWSSHRVRHLVTGPIPGS